MKGFVKIMLATMAGVLLSGLLLLVVLLIIGLSSMSDSPQVKPCSVLVLDVRDVTWRRGPLPTTPRVGCVMAECRAA